jgi:hypothetical protein
METMDVDLNIVYHPAQAQILFESRSRNKVVAKGRRFGLTRAFSQYCIEQMLEGVTPILWVETTGNNIARYIERYFLPILRRLPKNMWNWRISRRMLVIGNAVMDLRSADRPENIEGFGYNLIILNEAGIILKNEYLWHNAIRPMMIDFNSPILAGGTPKGKGLFYQLFRRGLEEPSVSGKERDWESFHFTTYDNPYISRANVDDIGKDMPSLIYRQEILAEFLEGEAFVFPGHDKIIHGDLEHPVLGVLYVAGLDLAKHMDWTVLTIMNEKRHVVWQGRIQKRDWGFQKEWIESHVRRYNNAPIWIDASSIGDVVMDDLRARALTVHPYYFHPKSKRELIHALILDVEQEKISYPAALTELTREMRAFEVVVNKAGDVNYSAPSGYHDDCVVSLALANWGSRTGVTEYAHVQQLLL